MVIIVIVVLIVIDIIVISTIIIIGISISIMINLFFDESKHGIEKIIRLDTILFLYFINNLYRILTKTLPQQRLQQLPHEYLLLLQLLYRQYLLALFLQLSFQIIYLLCRLILYFNLNKLLL